MKKATKKTPRPKVVSLVMGMSLTIELPDGTRKLYDHSGHYPKGFKTPEELVNQITQVFRNLTK